MTKLRDIPAMTGNYQLNCSVRTPQLIVFLLDRGRTMADSFQGKTKIEIACRTINRLIDRLGRANVDKDTIKNRYHIIVLGYGEDYLELCSGYLNDLFDNPLRIEETMRDFADGAGGLITVPVRSFVFVDTAAQKIESNLLTAIMFAKAYIEAWLSDKNESPAPIVVNVSDGDNLDVSLIDKVSSSLDSLRALPSLDGPSLFYSMLIGSDVDISVLDKNNLNEHRALLQDLVSSVPNNHCQCIYFSYNPEEYDSIHSPLIGLTTHENELYSIINASAGFGRAYRLEWD